MTVIVTCSIPYMSDGEYLYTYDGQTFEIYDLCANAIDKLTLM